jgi:hypothetical protein
LTCCFGVKSGLGFSSGSSKSKSSITVGLVFTWSPFANTVGLLEGSKFHLLDSSFVSSVGLAPHFGRVGVLSLSDVYLVID